MAVQIIPIRAREEDTTRHPIHGTSLSIGLVDVSWRLLQEDPNFYVVFDGINLAGKRHPLT